MTASTTLFCRASLTLGAAFLVTACQPTGMGGPSTGPTIDPRQPVPVALLVPTGAEPGIASALSNAARMAAADVRGATIDLRIYDSGSSSASAAAAAQKAVDAGAKIIVGPLHAEAANGVGTAVLDEGINVLAFSNNPAVAGGNVFIVGSTFDNTANRLVRYARSQGKSRIFLTTGDDIAGQTAGAAVEGAIARNGARLAGKQVHTQSVQGVEAAAPAVAAAAKSGQADAIMLTGDPYGALPFMLKALGANGVSPATTQYMGLTRWDANAQVMADPAAQGAWVALPDPRTYDQFAARYRAAYGAAPHPLAGLAYDAVAAIGALAARGNANALTTAGLTSSSGFAGVNGAFRLNRDGTNSRALAIGQIRGNQIVVVDPAPRSFGGAGF
ncbi:penicillin-binding protein activator [Paracoccus sp. p4-l81]|uniref:penicillin-binding protein activator n=1 Tax=unclassified Paracoccus (in: a-proteobacteria) TaxID=2688777 RepID=UPI0035B9E8F8